MGWWIERNLPPLLGGFGLGAVLTGAVSGGVPFLWVLGGLAGVGLALPAWQALLRR